MSAGERVYSGLITSHFLDSKGIAGASTLEGQGDPAAFPSQQQGQGERNWCWLQSRDLQSITGKVIACLEGRKDFAAIFVTES